MFNGLGAARQGVGDPLVGPRRSTPVRPVSLAEARERALSNRKLAHSGGDPLAEMTALMRCPWYSDSRRFDAGKPILAGRWAARY
ncbi:MAG: hypothetical protein OXH52_17515 [Gammaproteobacteria bacterium]|nr:hypothetical protein [Gammaproteobacteria bacterium]